MKKENEGLNDNEVSKIDDTCNDSCFNMSLFGGMNNRNYCSGIENGNDESKNIMDVGSIDNEIKCINLVDNVNNMNYYNCTKNVNNEKECIDVDNFSFSPTCNVSQKFVFIINQIFLINCLASL